MHILTELCVTDAQTDRERRNNRPKMLLATLVNTWKVIGSPQGLVKEERGRWIRVDDDRCITYRWAIPTPSSSPSSPSPPVPLSTSAPLRRSSRSYPLHPGDIYKPSRLGRNGDGGRSHPEGFV